MTRPRSSSDERSWSDVWQPAEVITPVYPSRNRATAASRTLSITHSASSTEHAAAALASSSASGGGGGTTGASGEAAQTAPPPTAAQRERNPRAPRPRTLLGASGAP